MRNDGENVQLSQMFRRGIVVPLNDKAEEVIRAWQAPDISDVRFLPIENQGMFDAILRSGIFSALNDSCQCLIDDYEEERLEPEVLEQAIFALSKKNMNLATEELRSFRNNLLAFIVEAREKNRPVVFVL